MKRSDVWILLLEKHVSWAKEMEQTNELSKCLFLVRGLLQATTIELGLIRIQFMAKYCDSNRYFKDILDAQAHSFQTTRR